MPAASASSPQLVLARLTAETQRIRLGAGGVMLPNHASLLVAEQFGMLDALAPGRIDLGLGRAPGTDPATATALRRGVDANDAFPQQVLELLHFLGEDFPDGHPYRDVHAVPGPWQADQNRVPRSSSAPDVWLLGTSPALSAPRGPTGPSVRLRLAVRGRRRRLGPPALPGQLPAVRSTRRAAYSHQRRSHRGRRPRGGQATGTLLGDGHAAHVPAAALRPVATGGGRRAPEHGARTSGARRLHSAVPQRSPVRCRSCPGTPARSVALRNTRSEADHLSPLHGMLRTFAARPVPRHMDSTGTTEPQQPEDATPKRRRQSKGCAERTA